MPRRHLTALLTVALIACTPGAALAATDRAALHASFSPDRLGSSTTVGFSFELTTADGLAPTPLTAMDLHLPAGIGYATTELGLALCSAHTLLTAGPSACPANSHLGYGSARVEVPFGSGAGHEIPQVQALAGPSSSGNLDVLFYADGLYPVSAQLAFSGEVRPDHGRYGSQLATQIPLVASVPGGPDVSIVQVQATIGPSQLTYYRRSHGHLERFRPRGVAVPTRCPTGGFPFAARFSFEDGSTTSASTTVPCPHR